MRMPGGRCQKDNLGRFHRVIRGKHKSKCVAFIFIDGAGSPCNGNTPLINAVRLFHGHSRDGWILDRPLRKLPRQAALGYAGQLFTHRAGGCAVQTAYVHRRFGRTADHAASANECAARRRRDFLVATR